MPVIKLTQGKEAIVSEEDFEYLNQWKWYHSEHYYAARNDKPHMTRMHRVVMERVLGGPIPKGWKVDHINRERLDNTRGNLRLVTDQQNATNRRKSHGKTSRFKGVAWCSAKRKWGVRIAQNDKARFVGWFNDEVAAARAYDAKAKELFGEYAGLNFQEDGSLIQVCPPNETEKRRTRCPECERPLKKTPNGWACPKAMQDFPVDENGKQYTRLGATHTRVRFWRDGEIDT